MNLIDKDTLITEMERRRDAALMRQQNLEAIGQETALNEIVAFELNRIISFINTMEIKEFDLKEEIKEVQRDYKTIEEYEGYPCTMYANDIEWIARHFFEIGLKTLKGE